MDGSDTRTPRSGQDPRGVPVSYANQDAIEGLERAIKLSLSFRGDAIAEIDKVLDDHPDFIMGWLFKAGWLTQAMETRIYGIMVDAVKQAENAPPTQTTANAGILRPYRHG